MFSYYRMSFPSLSQLKPSEKDQKIIINAENFALAKGYELLKLISENHSHLQIATSESLTGGLMMSTLIKIPRGGWHKYGCFGVYDTDAKRVFNTVKTDDVYTHKCAKEMAVGLLKNSNATLGLAVTGNAMPYPVDKNRLGEVFIGIAGYIQDGGKTKIKHKTVVINNCLDTVEPGVQKICGEWFNNTKADPLLFAESSLTSAVSLLIRNYTTATAFEECKTFINDNKLISPSFIENAKKTNNTLANDGCTHNSIPAPKYSDRDFVEIGGILDCKRGDNIKVIPESGIIGGRKRRKTRRKKKKRKKRSKKRR